MDKSMKIKVIFSLFLLLFLSYHAFVSMASSEERHERLIQDRQDKIKPVSEWLSVCTGEKVYSGEKVSLDFEDAELHDIILLFADLGKFEIFFENKVCGTVNLDKKDIPWDKVLEEVTEKHGLKISCDRNIMRVSQLNPPCPQKMTSEIFSLYLEKGIPGDAKITLRRTNCYGTCPVYRLSIYGNGKVIFKGQEYVKKTGKAMHTISDEKVKQIFSLFNEVDFFSFQDEYLSEEDGCTMATDHPSSIISIKIDDYEKRTHVDHGCFGIEKLGNLYELEKDIVKLSGAKSWMNDKDE